MSSIVFAPAVRSASPARICLHGPGGSGKTFTSLMLMDALCNHQRFAVIDTERGKSSWYEGINGWAFNTWCPQSFSPEALIEGLGVAAGAGFPGVVIDSWSHFWNGVDGMLEQVDKRTANANRRDQFSSGWKEMAPIEQRMLGAILSYPGHVIVTLRVKVEYVVEEVEKNGRTVSAPRKVGLKPIQREGFEYEFDIIGGLDAECTLTIDKTRVPTLAGAIIHRPDPELAETLQAWLTKGEQLPGPLVYRQRALAGDASFYGLRDLLEEVTAAGLANAPVVDAEGNPTVLAELVKARAVLLRPVAQATTQAAVSTADAPAPERVESPEVPAQRSGEGEPAAVDTNKDWTKLINAAEAAADLAALRELYRKATGKPEHLARITSAVTQIRHGHMKYLFKMLAEGGITGSEEHKPLRHRFASRVLGKPVDSFTALQAGDVATLAAAVAAHKKPGDLMAWLATQVAEDPAESTEATENPFRVLVDRILSAPDANAAAAVRQEVAAGSDGDIDVTHLLTTDDRDALGYPEGQPLLLCDLAAKGVEYATRHKTGPRVPPIGEAA